MKELPFRANGHRCSLADGAVATVFDDLALPRSLSPFIPQLGSARCWTCGDALELAVSDDSVSVREPCAYPDGITTVITLAVPSGRLIVSDSLRPAYDWREEDLTAGYNCSLGQAQAIRVMAAQGCAFGYVGNSCPGLYRTGDGTYAVASPAYDEEADKELPPDGWEELAGIITDLWAYSIADYADWENRDAGRSAARWGRTAVDVTPGTYEFTHHTGERSFRGQYDSDGTVIYAHARLLR